MPRFFVRAAASIAFALFASACDGGDGGGNGGGDDGGNGGSGGGCGREVEITENVTSNTTWSCGLYVVRKWDFYVDNATLVIEPGTVVKFHPTEGPTMTLSGSAVVTAVGTPALPIVFTSFKDDTHGGDTNADGAATAPAAGDWTNVATNGTNGSTFEWCQFLYGGAGSHDSTLELQYSTASVRNSVIAYGRGATNAALDAINTNSGTVITGNTFYGNQKPLYIEVSFSVDDSNQFHNPANVAETNAQNGIFVNDLFNVTSNIAWLETEVAFVISNHNFWVNSGYTLTLGGDVVLKFMQGAGLLLEDGESALPNHGGSGVWFTAYEDDTRKGNTDGAASSPTAGSWLGIYDNRASAYFAWPNVSFAANP
jgi:hypothetical protein